MLSIKYNAALQTKT